MRILEKLFSHINVLLCMLAHLVQQHPHYIIKATDLYTVNCKVGCKIYKPRLIVAHTDYRRPERKQPSLHGRKFTPTPKFLGMAAVYFVCHIGPIFQISLIYAFIGCPQSVNEFDLLTPKDLQGKVAHMQNAKAALAALKKFSLFFLLLFTFLLPLSILLQKISPSKVV